MLKNGVILWVAGKKIYAGYMSVLYAVYCVYDMLGIFMENIRYKAGGYPGRVKQIENLVRAELNSALAKPLVLRLLYIIIIRERERERENEHDILEKGRFMRFRTYLTEFTSISYTE